MKIVLTDAQLAGIQGRPWEITAWVQETPGAKRPSWHVSDDLSYTVEQTGTSMRATFKMPTITLEFPDEVSAALFKLRWL